MKTVFMSGSRRISRLSQEVRKYLEIIILQNLEVAIGDAGGSDKAIQSFFAGKKYPLVTIYCTGSTCRNNVGRWKVHKVEADTRFTGRAFYTLKDKEMAKHANAGMVLWDGKSIGSFNNILEMASQSKNVDVYFSPAKEFIKVSNLNEAKELLSKCETKDISEIETKSDLRNYFEKSNLIQQKFFDM